MRLTIERLEKLSSIRVYKEAAQDVRDSDVASARTPVPYLDVWPLKRGDIVTPILAIAAAVDEARAKDVLHEIARENALEALAVYRKVGKDTLAPELFALAEKGDIAKLAARLPAAAATRAKLVQKSNTMAAGHALRAVIAYGVSREPDTLRAHLGVANIEKAPPLVVLAFAAANAAHGHDMARGMLDGKKSLGHPDVQNKQRETLRRLLADDAAPSRRPSAARVKPPSPSPAAPRKPAKASAAASAAPRKAAKASSAAPRKAAKVPSAAPRKAAKASSKTSATPHKPRKASSAARPKAPARKGPSR